MKKNKLPIIAALDNIDHEQIIPFIENDIPEISTVKIGLELFNRYGKDLLFQIESVVKKEYFLDLKLHDIPNTVHQAIYGLSGLNPKFLTIHLTGGRKMIEKALEARDKYLPATQILGVSYLTSLSEEEMLDVWGKNKKELMLMATQLANKTSIDGIVCSAEDLKDINNMINNKIIVTPGIRAKGQKAQDQQRIMSPEDALRLGSDYLVVGRPLKDPIQKKQILKSVESFYLSQ